MSELTAPHTPRPEHSMRRSEGTPLSSPVASNDKNIPSTSQESPPSPPRAMTPPPSTQPPKLSSRSSQARGMPRRENSLASPPATLKIGPPVSSGGLFGEIPSPDAVQKMDEDQLRKLVSELLPAFGEARVNAAHSKLQHSLLSIETEEAAKRAAVEHEATRREVQILQEGSPVQRNHFSPTSPQAFMQRNLHDALEHCRNLQQQNSILEKRLRSAKKVISQLDNQNAELKDSIHLLRQRIKENRDHLTDLQSAGAISVHGTPAVGQATPIYSRTPKTPANISRTLRDPNQTPGLDALILAGEVVNGEANSVPSSPTLIKAKKTPAHHVRGAHSLSSLPTTPNRSRPVSADHALNALSRYALEQHGSLSAAGTNLTYHEDARAREDRESTISASEDECEAHSDADLPGSQASQMASSMLRRSLGPPKESNVPPTMTPESSKIMQAKLFGHIQKPGVSNARGQKRAHAISPGGPTGSSKKPRKAGAKLDGVGLGIQSLPKLGV